MSKVNSVNGSALFQYLAALTCTLSIATSGMHYGWPSPSLPKLLDENSSFNITDDEGSWLAVMPLVGAVVGSLTVAIIVDILGRKVTIILATVPYFSAWVLVAFARSVELLYVARFIAGVADGLVFTSVPMYIAEIAESRIRGLLGSGVTAIWISGTLLINIIGSYFSIRTTALISSSVPLLCFATFIWMPESPYYLLMKNNQPEAKRSLEKFRGMTNVEKELDRLVFAVKEQTTDTGKFLDLFTSNGNRRAVYICMLLRATQQLSGTSAITFYTQPIFKEAGGGISPEVATFIFYSVQVVVAMISSSMVDRIGRRPLLIISVTGSAVSLFIEGTYFYIQSSTSLDIVNYSFVPTVALMGYVVLFSMGMLNIPVLILGEVFPANVKAFAICLADIYFGILATSAAKFFQITKDSFGIYVPFYAFTLTCVLGIGCIARFVPETKGKTLEEIQCILNKSEKVVKQISD